MRYRVNWQYQTAVVGPLAVGQIVDLTPSEADAINLDSPGVLTAVGELPDAERALASATGERQVKAARNRAKTRAGANR